MFPQTPSLSSQSLQSHHLLITMVDIVPQSDRHSSDQTKKQDVDAVQIERVLSGEDMEKKDHMNFDRVDNELAKYANAERVEISEAENKRLKKMIDKRVLTIMIITYFVQALDKGTMSFASIMGIREDLSLKGPQVRPTPSVQIQIR